MPYYEFYCKNCRLGTAAMLPMENTFAKDEKCKNCGKKDWQQVYFPPAIKFNGTGFYETDYKTKEK